MTIETFTGYGFLVPTLEIYDFLQIYRLEEVDPNSEAVVYADVQKHYAPGLSYLDLIQPWVQEDVDTGHILVVWAKTVARMPQSLDEGDTITGVPVQSVSPEEAQAEAGEYAETLGIYFWQDDPNILTYEDYASEYLGGHVTEPLF